MGITKQDMIFRCEESTSLKITNTQICQYKLYAVKSFSWDMTTITKDSKMRGTIFKALSFRIPSLIFFNKLALH